MRANSVDTMSSFLIVIITIPYLNSVLEKKVTKPWIPWGIGLVFFGLAEIMACFAYNKKWMTMTTISMVVCIRM